MRGGPEAWDGVHFRGSNEGFGKSSPFPELYLVIFRVQDPFFWDVGVAMLRRLTVWLDGHTISLLFGVPCLECAIVWVVVKELGLSQVIIFRKPHFVSNVYPKS